MFCFQAEDGIRDIGVTGVQTCALPILLEAIEGEIASVTADGAYDGEPVYQAVAGHQPDPPPEVVIPPRSSAVPSTGTAGGPPSRRRSEERRVGKERRSRWAPYH